MSKQYQVSYKVEGIQVVNVWLPEGTDVPLTWNQMSLSEQDEWLYENQESSAKQYEDIHYSTADSVLEVKHLRLIQSEVS